MGELGGVVSAATTQAAMSLLDQLMMNLKAINIENLMPKEKEQLRFLSTQYQFHLTQFQQYQKQQILLGNFIDKVYGSGNGNKEARRQSGKEGGVKDEPAANVYSSQERFKLNENNLSEFRLKKGRAKNETTPGPTDALISAKGENQISNSATSQHDKKDEAGNSKSNSQISRTELNQQANTDGTMVASQSQQNLKVTEQVTAEGVTGTKQDLSTANSSNVNKIADQSPRPETEDGIQPLPALPFQFHLNLPHPVPQISNQDIKSLTSQQRIHLFKQLQKRERNKFLSI